MTSTASISKLSLLSNQLWKNKSLNQDNNHNILQSIINDLTKYLSLSKSNTYSITIADFIICLRLTLLLFNSYNVNTNNVNTITITQIEHLFDCLKHISYNIHTITMNSYDDICDANVYFIKIYTDNIQSFLSTYNNNSSNSNNSNSIEINQSLYNIFYSSIEILTNIAKNNTNIISNKKLFLSYCQLFLISHLSILDTLVTNPSPNGHHNSDLEELVYRLWSVYLFSDFKTIEYLATCTVSIDPTTLTNTTAPSTVTTTDTNTTTTVVPSDVTTKTLKKKVSDNKHNTSYYHTFYEHIYKAIYSYSLSNQSSINQHSDTSRNRQANLMTSISMLYKTYIRISDKYSMQQQSTSIYNDNNNNNNTSNSNSNSNIRIKHLEYCFEFFFQILSIINLTKGHNSDPFSPTPSTITYDIYILNSLLSVLYTLFPSSIPYHKQLIVYQQRLQALARYAIDTLDTLQLQLQQQLGGDAPSQSPLMDASLSNDSQSIVSHNVVDASKSQSKRVYYTQCSLHLSTLSLLVDIDHRIVLTWSEKGTDSGSHAGIGGVSGMGGTRKGKGGSTATTTTAAVSVGASGHKQDDDALQDGQQQKQQRVDVHTEMKGSLSSPTNLKSTEAVGGQVSKKKANNTTINPIYTLMTVLLSPSSLPSSYGHNSDPFDESYTSFVHTNSNNGKSGGGDDVAYVSYEDAKLSVLVKVITTYIRLQR